MLYITLPEWLRTWLGYLNYHLDIPPWSWSIFGLQVLSAGDWLSLDLSVGNWILWALDAALGGINDGLAYLYSLGTLAWGKAVDAYNLAMELGAKIIQTVYQTVENIYQTITNVINNVYQTVENIVSNVYQTVTNVFQSITNTIVGVTEDVVRTLIAAALSPLAAPLNILLYFYKEIGEFFADPPGWIFDKIDNWLNDWVV